MIESRILFPKLLLTLLSACLATSLLGQVHTSKTVELRTEKINSGILGDQQQFDFPLQADDAMLLSVSQPNANAVVSVFSLDELSNPTKISESSIPDTGWLDEKVFVTGKQCRLCRVQISPASKTDSFGSFELVVQPISDWPSKPESQVFKFWTQASEKWHTIKDDAPEKLQKVLDTYQHAAVLARRLNDNLLIVRSQYLASRVIHRQHKYSSQKQLLEELLLTHTIETSDIYPLILWDLADIALIDNQLDEASRYTDRLTEFAISKNDPLLQAIIYTLNAYIFRAQGQYKHAEELYTKLNNIYLSTGNWRKSVETQTAVGWFQYRKGEPDKAMQNYKSALIIATKAGLHNLQIDLNTKIATVYRSRGQVDRASQYIAVAIELSQSLSNSRVVGWAKQEQAQIYIETGLLELARDVLDDAKHVFQSINAHRDVSNIDYFLAGTYLQLNDYSQADKYLNLVLEYDLVRGSDYDIGTGYNRLALMALSQNKPEQALQYQRKAIEYLSDSDDKFLSGRLHSQAATVFSHNQMYDESQEYFALANEIQTALPDRFGQIQTRYQEALMLSNKGDKRSALNILSQVVEDIRSDRQNISATDLKKNFLAIQQDIISLQIALMRDTEATPTQTLMLSDSFRSATLADRFTRMHAAADIEPRLLDKRKALEAVLQQGVVDYQTLSNAESRHAIVKQARKTLSELHALDAAIDEAHKREAAATSTLLHELDIAGLQQSLSDTELALYFDTSQQESHLWVISNKDIQYQRLPPERQLQEPVTELLALIGNPPMQTRRKQQLSRLIGRISKMLFDDVPVAWDKVENLIIIPDGPLNYLPFSVLKTPTIQGDFLDSINLTYSQSLSVLSQLQARKTISTAQQEILIVANPALRDSQNQRILQTMGSRAGFSSHELPFTQKELKAIQSNATANTRVLERENASKHNFMAMPLLQFNILHFATHGLANNYVPAMGGLVFSNTNTANNLLLAPEIANLKLNAELVVLSACETGYGRLISGEGLQGLSRSFFEAGTQRVIASLWSVQDDATAALMAAFYEHLLQGNKPVEEALRLAKLDVKNYQRKNRQRPWRDPFYWAGFVLQGLGGKISG